MWSSPLTRTPPREGPSHHAQEGMLGKGSSWLLRDFPTANQPQLSVPAPDGSGPQQVLFGSRPWHLGVTGHPPREGCGISSPSHLGLDQATSSALLMTLRPGLRCLLPRPGPGLAHQAVCPQCGRPNFTPKFRDQKWLDSRAPVWSFPSLSPSLLLNSMSFLM